MIKLTGNEKVVTDVNDVEMGDTLAFLDSNIIGCVCGYGDDHYINIKDSKGNIHFDDMTNGRVVLVEKVQPRNKTVSEVKLPRRKDVEAKRTDVSETTLTPHQLSNAYDYSRHQTIDALNALREARKYGFKLFQHEFISTKDIALHSATLFCISISCKNVLDEVLVLPSEDVKTLIKEVLGINENLKSDAEFILTVSPVTTWG